ncbi:conserved hypothetical protein [Trichinella spiralis]|uniref:hypothetical protein n=1 Tax=Trichinella spiralis TaxID=6334 RepID=UPI0001EFEBBC|nr:conserved hypothetical protein [Trichinella spiralis]
MRRDTTTIIPQECSNISKAKLDVLQASLPRSHTSKFHVHIKIFSRTGSGVHVAIVFYRQSRNIFHPHVSMLVEYVFVGQKPSHVVTPMLLYSQTSVWDNSSSQNEFFRKMVMLLVSLAGFKLETASAAHTMFLLHCLNNSSVLNNFDSEIAF